MAIYMRIRFVKLYPDRKIDNDVIRRCCRTVTVIRAQTSDAFNRVLI